jgi:hypothetical protein
VVCIVVKYGKLRSPRQIAKSEAEGSHASSCQVDLELVEMCIEVHLIMPTAPSSRLVLVYAGYGGRTRSPQTLVDNNNNDKNNNAPLS